MRDGDRIRATYAGYEASGRGRLWDRANPGYARLADDRDRGLIAILERCLPRERGAALLDVGCGDGSLIGRALARWPSLAATGIDLLPDRIDAAQRDVPTARFVAGSADALPFATGAFDMVAAVTLFSSMPSQAMESAAASEIARVLRPGGWLVWYDLRYRNPWNREVHPLRDSRIAQLFPGWSRELGTITLLPPVARRLGPLTPVAYPLLHAIPPLRSHLIGRLRCPG